MEYRNRDFTYLFTVSLRTEPEAAERFWEEFSKRIPSEKGGWVFVQRGRCRNRGNIPNPHRQRGSVPLKWADRFDVYVNRCRRLCHLMMKNTEIWEILNRRASIIRQYFGLIEYANEAYKDIFEVNSPSITAAVPEAPSEYVTYKPTGPTPTPLSDNAKTKTDKPGNTSKWDVTIRIPDLEITGTNCADLEKHVKAAHPNAQLVAYEKEDPYLNLPLAVFVLKRPEGNRRQELRVQYMNETHVAGYEMGEFHVFHRDSILDRHVALLEFSENRNK